MHNNFETLEKRCKLYYLKQKLKIIIPLLFISTLITIYTIFFKKEVTQIIETKNYKSEIIKEKKQIENIKPIINSKIIKDVKYNMQLNNNLILNEKDSSIKYNNKVKIIEPLNLTKNTENFKQKTTNFSISTKKLESTKDMITLYNKENDYDLALKIAQRYYKSKKYSTALLWTKKANILNKKADGAWILYAKSEYAKGNYKRAIEILNLYLANANSKEGESLLITWTQGK